MVKLKLLLTLLTLTTICQASNLTFEFGNPSFSGEGYSSHVLSISQLEYNRKKEVAEDLISAAAKAARDAKNTTLAKFVTNVESRIYANLSKQMVDNMFGINCTPTDDSVAYFEECPTSDSVTLTGDSSVSLV